MADIRLQQPLGAPSVRRPLGSHCVDMAECHALLLNIPTHDPNGNPTLFSYIDAFENGGRYTTYKDQTDQQFSSRINPIEGLNINGEFNYRNWSNHDKRYYLQTGYYGPQGNYIENNPNDWPAGSPIGSRVYNYSQKRQLFQPQHLRRLLAHFQQSAQLQDHGRFPKRMEPL